MKDVRHKHRNSSGQRALRGFILLCSVVILLGTEHSFAGANNRGDFALEEVVVTARKRTESLQDTPIAISAYTAKSLEIRQVTSTTDLGDITPNLTFDGYAPSAGSSSTSQIFIRGIGQVDFTAVTDPGVGLYVDGVYYARSVGTALDILDIERIEVLRGPQGTLFGRNTIGGAISLHTKKPTAEFGGSIQAQIGSDSMRYATGILNVPITDTLLSKATLWRRKRDGYVKRVYGGDNLGNDDKWGARFQLMWTPSDKFSAILRYDYTNARENGAPNVSLGINEQGTFAYLHNVFSPSCPLTPPPGPPGPGRETGGNPNCANLTSYLGPYKNGGTARTESKLDYWGVSLTATWDISQYLKIKSISAYRKLDSTFARDADGTPFLIFHTVDFFDQNQFSQEFQFTGKLFEDRLNWLIGAYYFEEKADDPNPVYFPVQVGAFTSGGSTNNDNYAGFAQATYSFTSKLNLTVGTRYTRETKRFKPLSIIDILPYFNPADGVLPIGSRLVPAGQVKEKFKEWTPMADLAYHWTDHLMTYLSYAEGFKSGGFDQRYNQVFPSVSGFGPEKAVTYEFGLKSQFLNNRVRLNMAIYHTNYQDMQIIVREGFAPITFNAGRSEIQGFELETEIVPVSNLLIQGSVGLIDAQYKHLSSKVLNNSPIRKDFKFPQTPKWSANLGISYSLSLGTWKVTPRVDLTYKSAVYNDAINTPQLRQGSYYLFNAALRFASDDGHWEAIVAGHNLTDERYLVTGNSAFNTGASYLEGIFGRKREWSLSAKYNF